MENILLNRLKNAGWYEGRECQIEHHIEVLKEEEYIVFYEAVKFLSEFSDLKIEFENPKRAKNYLTLNINPSDAVKSVFREVSKSYEEHCNEAFVIVGEIVSMDMTWYITSSGTFYGGNDDLLIRLGSDFKEALNNIISGKELEVIVVEAD